MSDFIKLMIYMSVSGTIVMLVLLILGRLLHNRVSKKWQYYIWLLVIGRLLLPISPEMNLMNQSAIKDKKSEFITILSKR